jgi:hypothetical protein
VRGRVREKRKNEEEKGKERVSGKRPNQDPPPPVVSDEQCRRCMVPVREQGPWPWWPWSKPRERKERNAEEGKGAAGK